MNTSSTHTPNPKQWLVRTSNSFHERRHPACCRTNSAWIFILFFAPALFAPQEVGAQSSPIQPARNWEQTTARYGTPANPEAPPTGNGTTPLPVTPGDQDVLPLPVTNSADAARTNSMFGTKQGEGRTRLHIFMQTTDRATGNSRGLREVQTIRLDQLSANQAQNILSIFNAQGAGNQQDINVTATSPSQIQQLENYLFPYPQNNQSSGDPKANFIYPPAQTESKNINGNDSGKDAQPNMLDASSGQQYANNGTVQMQQITSDYGNPPGIYDQRENKSSDNKYLGNWNDDTKHPLPSVRPFARYIVLAGVVMATVYMALAGWAVVCGHKDAGRRVVATASGLLLLLMGYTIWKLDIMNSMIPAITQAQDQNLGAASNYVNGGYPQYSGVTPLQKAGNNTVSAGNFPAANVPPALPIGFTPDAVQRGGIPLVPLGGAGNNN